MINNEGITYPIHKVQPEIIQKGWGHEEVIINDKVNGYCGKLLVFKEDGYRGSMHFHISKHEHFRVGAGKFRIECINPTNAEKYALDLVEGDIVEVPRGQSHRIICVEKGYIIEFSTPDEVFDSYRVEKGDSQK
jgi:mannose-6-phosphate isomerase-like protein (cupin superfamily)